jgi:hypothetical protein
VEKGSPRPFISVESDAVGTTDITNSELAFLGYEGGVNGGPCGWYYLLRWAWKYNQK